MIIHSKMDRIGYFSRLLAIPVVYLVSCAFSTGAKEGRSNHGIISASLFNDTLPAERIASVNPMDIESMEVKKDQNIVIIKLKNSDSVIYLKLSELKSNDSLSEASKQNDPVFTKVEHPAVYPGGQEAWLVYLNKNLHYPDSAVDQEKQGEVIVQFIVNKDGTLSNIKVIQKVIKSLDDEALRMVTNSGKWQPAVQNGHVVRAYVNQPIRFRLEAQ